MERCRCGLRYRASKSRNARASYWHILTHPFWNNTPLVPTVLLWRNDGQWTTLASSKLGADKYILLFFLVFQDLNFSNFLVYLLFKRSGKGQKKGIYLLSAGETRSSLAKTNCAECSWRFPGNKNKEFCYSQTNTSDKIRRSVPMKIYLGFPIKFLENPESSLPSARKIF
jgi:hypothetical protein